MSNYIVGAVTDYEADDIEPWLVSLCQHYGGPKAVITYNLTESLHDCLMDLGIEIWAAGQEPDTEGFKYFYKSRSMFNVCIERFWHLSKIMESRKNDVHFVLMTDTKDVVFQSNPLQRDRYDITDIVVTPENIRYRDEKWGRENLIHSFGSETFERLKDAEIYNAGVLGGHGSVFRDLLRNIYYLSKATGFTYVPGGGGPDQAALNVLLHQEVYSNFTGVLREFAAQAGTTNDPSKMVEYRDCMIYNPPLWQENKVMSIMGKAFPIVHQYDRVPEWNEYFKNKYTWENYENKRLNLELK